MPPGNEEFLGDIAHAGDVKGAQQQIRLPGHLVDQQGIRHLLYLPGPGRCKQPTHRERATPRASLRSASGRGPPEEPLRCP